MCPTSTAVSAAASAKRRQACDRSGRFRCRTGGAISPSLRDGGRSSSRTREARWCQTITVRGKAAAPRSSPIPVRPCPRQQPDADDMSGQGETTATSGDCMPQHEFGGRKAKALKHLMLTSTALVWLGQPIIASAADNWTGAASTDWFTVGNWNPAAVPTSGDDVTLNATFPNPTVIDGANAAAHYLFLGTIASHTGSLTIKNGGTLGSTAAFLGYLADANGVVTVTGAGSAWNNSSDLFLAASPSSTGTLTISNGGAVSDTVGHVGSGGTGIATVDGAGSTWTNSGDLYIAEHGTGTLAITKGGAVSNAVGTIGWHAGSNGTVTVDGASSTWTNSSNLFVGDQGTGALTVSGGGAVSNLSGILGNLAGSTGTATVG